MRRAEKGLRVLAEHVAQQAAVLQAREARSVAAEEGNRRPDPVFGREGIGKGNPAKGRNAGTTPKKAAEIVG